MCTKYCSRLALEQEQRLIYICCNNKDFSVGDLESSLQLLAKQDEKSAKDRAAWLMRLELRGVEQRG